MARNSSDQSWFQSLLSFHCDDCGCDSGFQSRRRNFTERFLLPIFLLRPARCAECFRRDYRLIFVRVQERISETASKPPISPIGPARTRNVA